MSFDAAWCWLLVPPLAVYVAWWHLRSYAQLEPWARSASLILRSLVLLLLIAALSRPSWLRQSSRSHVVFLLDVSRSVSEGNLDAALEEVDKLARFASKASGDRRISIVAFGRKPRLVLRDASDWDGWNDELREQLRYETSLPELYAERTRLISSGRSNDGDAELEPLQERISRIEAFRDEVAGEQTDINRAIRLALNCGRPGEQQTLYILTDGHFTLGRWSDALSAARIAGARLHVVALDQPGPAEVALTELVLPRSVRVNQGFSADLRIAATAATRAKLEIFRDGYVVEKRDIELQAGETTLRLTGLHFRDKGFHTVEVAVRPEQDTRLENNRIRSLIVVPGRARVLYIDGDETQAAYLKTALELEGIQVEVRPAVGVPNDLSDLLSFDAFILSNVPADRLAHRQMQMIKSYVEDFGGGFIMLGGDESFGLGGYFRTPIEEILPVRMPIQKDLLRPSLALMLVIDKSGSMAGVKIQLAKRAALATADAINPRDLIGLIGFDGESRILLELTPAADRATISSNIAALDAGGGTFLYPALEDAHRRLTESNARRKHVIVLSDGQTQGFGYDEKAQIMAADGITMSTVGIGEGADMRLLEAIAMSGGGRAYFTNDFYSIPQIFTREAMRASKSMLVERLFAPIAIGNDAALEEIDVEALPLLTGYVATTPKPAANVILVSDTADPILAKWRYGLGHTVAFTSETKPRWAEDWIDWEDFAKFWSQLVRSVTGENLARRVSLQANHRRDGDELVLTADLRDEAGGPVAEVDVELTAVTPTGARSLPVERIGPGLFEARLPQVIYGRDQQFSWRYSAPQSDQPDTDAYGFVYSFSPEFQSLGPATEEFERLRARADVQISSVGRTQPDLAPPIGVDRLSLWPALLTIALLLAPIDILCRRLG